MQARTQEKKHLSANGLIKLIAQKFSQVPDPAKGSGGKKPDISIQDCMLSGLAIFGLKYSSLLQFDREMREGPISHNLKSLYRIEQVPSDTYLRSRLDDLDTDSFRSAFTSVFAMLQRGKVLEQFEFIDGHYLCLIDGTGYFSSNRVHCEHCCMTQHKGGSVKYSHMMLGAVIAHPDRKEVIPLCPEPILRQDGAQKNDCERNACKRLIPKLRREHPHLPLIVAEDGLASNAPHLRLLQAHNIRFITVVKPKGNKTLFEWIKGIKATKVEVKKDGITKVTSFINGVPLNNADHDLSVNFLEYSEYDAKGKRTYYNTWVTDLIITEENAFIIAKGGRARWKIESVP